MFNKEPFHEPQTINDIIFGNPESRLRIQDIVSNTETIPSCGKSAILLYGVLGQAKPLSQRCYLTQSSKAKQVKT